MKIGQKVIVNYGENNELHGIYAGTGVMQRFENGPMETMALVRLNPVDSGYLHSGGNPKLVAFIASVVVHPDNITVVEE